ncbi:MAG: argininosuccinate synthase [Sandaracinus sp.]|nr:argininosuccinate synthase [Sandaracinus sp.]|tara:strand:- start:526 stop:1752 length:1227 start_codon:yes stop_codon:yes gene_type:complete
MSAVPTPKKIVLAYSGGLDTSVILTWLKETYPGCQVVAFCADVGQGEELSGLDEKAKATGAEKCVVADVREEFVKDFVFPMLRANAVYEGTYLLGTSIARPVIAKAMMDVAHAEGADAIAHGATGKGNDQVRFELSAMAIDPRVQVIAPWRTWNLKSRSDCIAYCKERNIPVEATAEKPYSMDANAFHISYEGGILEDPWAAPPEDIFRWTKSAQDAPDEPREVVIRYEAGNPVAIDGDRMTPFALLERLNQLGSEHGVGRVDVVENRFVGMKSRGVYETPGGTILQLAHRAVESLAMDREVMRIRDGLIPEYASLVYRGFWFAPEREALQALIDESQKDVYGEARIRLYKGSAQVVGRRSERSLYDPEVATFEADEVYDQSDATGFIRLNALRLRLRATRDAAEKDG